MRSARVILFDIDGTLVDCGGDGKRAMEAAFERFYGVPQIFEGFTFGGRTDRAIVRHGLEKLGHEATLDRVNALIDGYLEELGRLLPTSPRFRVLAGAESAARRATESGAAVGLGTGNVSAGARAKMQRAGLEPWFSFGGYGCDAEDRAELIEHGVRRGAAKLGADRSRCEVLIVGDTPRDIEAAHAVGGKCLAVATGKFDRSALEAAGADEVTDSLESPEASRWLER